MVDGARGASERRLGRILIVDDEQVLLDIAERHFRAASNHFVRCVNSGREALAALARGKYDVVLLDLVMPEVGGLQVMQQYRSAGGEMPKVIVITGFPSVETALEAGRLGAHAYLTKPFSLPELVATIEEILPQRQTPLSGLVGGSPRMERIRQQIQDVAGTEMAVLIEGETGTGKELVAREIHGCSGRRGPFVACSCGALAPGLVASELFGHVKGAFTGAVSNRRGRFEEADGGTLFLDEIAEIDAATQVQLLRVLEEHEFEPVGSSTTRRVDVRIVAATNRSLAGQVAEGRFRKDLYYRIKGFFIETPPLRERKEDLPALCAHVLANLATRTGGRTAALATEAMALLHSYNWPGNVRELENVLNTGVVMSRGGQIRPEHLAVPAAEPERHEEIETASVYQVVATKLHAAREAFEKQFLERALERHGGNVMRTAEAIGIGRRTLQEKIERHGIEVVRGGRGTGDLDAGKGSADRTSEGEETNGEP